ncbi:MAG: hypothetical protein M0T70_08525 [Geobacteraceae bacterium]|nr:hypothetical protein [Geobacteraceae bacterium]
MKVHRYIIILLTMCMFMMLQACGSGNTDTSGALTLTTPTAKDNGDGTYSVSTTVTYAPPTGKSAQGVIVSLQISDSNGNTLTDRQTLTSGSNSFTYGLVVVQNNTSSTYVSLVASIGDMKSSTFVIVPKYTPPIAVTQSSVTFPDSTSLPSPVQLTISGGTAPYSVASSTADIGAVVNTSTLTISLVNPSSSSPGVAANPPATVTITDSTTPTPLTKTVTVNYFK